jgi:aldose 1-epimerase
MQTNADRYSARADGDDVVLADAGAGAEARIAAARGNNVVQFRVALPGREAPVDVFLPPSGPDGLGPNGYGAGNPILFPFPNRVRGGKYAFEGKEYQLDINEPARGNHIHGLVSNRPWTLEGIGSSEDAGAWQRASIQLDAFSDVVRQYPFPCRVTVLTRLKDGVLSQEIAVENTGNGSLPMGYGTHPWFAAALDGADREETRVSVLGNAYWQLEDLVPTGQIVSVNEQPEWYDLREWPELDGRHFDDVFTDLIRREDGWTEAGLRYPNAGAQLTVEASPEFREWVIYAPLDRPVVCLEPYTGTTNFVNLEPQGVDAGLLVHAPGAVWTATIRTSLQPYA